MNDVEKPLQWPAAKRVPNTQFENNAHWGQTNPWRGHSKLRILHNFNRRMVISICERWQPKILCSTFHCMMKNMWSVKTRPDFWSDICILFLTNWVRASEKTVPTTTQEKRNPKEIHFGKHIRMHTKVETQIKNLILYWKST